MPDDKNDDGRALSAITQALDWAYARAVEGVKDFAEEYKYSHPGGGGSGGGGSHFDPAIDAAIDDLIKWQVLKAGLVGFVTGVPGGLALPVMIPADLAAVLYIQVRMIAAIAHLRGFDLESDKVKGLVLACLIGDAAGGLPVKAAGIKFGMRAAENGIKAIPRAAIIWINRTLGFRLLTKAGGTGVVNLVKIIPVVGGVVGGGIDAAVTRTIGGAAKKLFA